MTKRFDPRRQRSRWQSLYDDPQWRARRKRQLRQYPWCAMCAAQSKQTKAAIADHVERHGGDPIKFFRGRLQSLCKPHHDGAKQSHERGRRAGCDERGLPTDRGHPWSAQ